MTNRNRKRRPTPLARIYDLARRLPEPDQETDIPDDFGEEFRLALDDGVLGYGLDRQSLGIQRLDDVLLDSVPQFPWTSPHPPIVEIGHPKMRLLAVGDIQRTNHKGSPIHQYVDLFVGDDCVSWHDLVPLFGHARSRGDGEHAVKFIPYVEGCVGRARIEVNGWNLPTYATWFAMTSEGIRIPPRKTWEQHQRPGDG